MSAAQISPSNANTLNAVSHLLGTTKVTVDLSAEGVVIPIAPADGEITLDLNIATPHLRGSKTGFSAVYDFDGTRCGIFVPIAAIRNVEFVPAPKDVAEVALRLIERQ